MPLVQQGLGPIRGSIFVLDEPVCWTRDEFERLWPYCDNIWSFRKRLSPTRVLYRCRLERATRPKPKQDGVKHRKRSLREKSCSAHMVMEHFADGSVKIRRRGETAHAHDLAAVDKVKINSALKTLEKEELQKGYSPEAVWSALTYHIDGEGQKILEDAGGSQLDSAHVHAQSLLLKKGKKPAETEESPSLVQDDSLLIEPSLSNQIEATLEGLGHDDHSRDDFLNAF